MAGYKNFQTDNRKFRNPESRTNIYNPAFTSPVKALGTKEADHFTRNYNKYRDFISWARWYPDLWYDLITPQTGGIRLDLDQRVFLRCLVRFLSVYGVFPRGWSKTFLGFMAMVHTAIFYPDIRITLTAQTRENAAKLIREKFNDVTKFYPLIKNEITQARFQNDIAEIRFTSGSIIDTSANNQSTKGIRRHRLYVEESALLNNTLFEDVLEPVVNIPRRTIGPKAIVNPEEMNGQIHFFTTSGFRGSDEFERNIRMLDEMAELKGKIVIGAGWELPVHYGRGETKSQILDKKAKLSPIAFAQNYESKWVGATGGALVDINKFISLRTLARPELRGDGESEYIISMDISRSYNSTNSISSIAVLKIKRDKNNRVIRVPLVNLIHLPVGLTFAAQAAELKKVYNLYRPKAVVVDGNGLGIGLVDELVKDTLDPVTGESLGCWATMNTEHEPELPDAEEVVYVLFSQSCNHEIIVNFMNMVESGKLQLLTKRETRYYDIDDAEEFKTEVLPHIEVDFLVEEVANLKTKQLQNGQFAIEQLTKRVGKDRYSAVAYGLWYISKFEDNYEEENNYSALDYLFIN